eukprot:s2436_g1.t1
MRGENDEQRLQETTKCIAEVDSEAIPRVKNVLQIEARTAVSTMAAPKTPNGQMNRGPSASSSEESTPRTPEGHAEGQKDD